MNFYSLSDKGMIRTNNEDYTESFQLRVCHMDGTVEICTVLLLADGMGGAAAGEYASALAVTSVKRKLMSAFIDDSKIFCSDNLCPLLNASCNEANRAVYTEAKKDPERKGMGTTLVVGVINSDVLSLCHVGDSRCYLYREGSLKQLTHDHSLVQEMVDAGYITPEEAEHHPQKNIITRAVGVEPIVEVDTMSLPIFAGDLLLLASDGLFGFLSEAEIKEVLDKQASQPNADLKHLAVCLINGANANGGADNISVCLYKH